MGAGLGQRLTEGGCRVLTSLAGRGDDSRRRAAEAGMADASDEALASADMVLSVVPPSQALAFAERLAPALSSAIRKPVYVDCNAVSPQTVQDIAALIEPTGAPFVDAGIVGPPPKPGYSPAIYASGPHATQFAALASRGLDIRVLSGPIGRASALKMSYSAMNKGLYAIGVSAILGAIEAGVEEAFLAEIASSQPHVLAYLVARTPGVFSKTYRWGAEMQEVGRFLGGPAEQIYDGAAQLYEHLAADHAGSKTAEAAVLAFLRRRGDIG
jgi:3-hydroxyisobutyrate dehydrogenase-like beta-hydroxyacid dehydrogenase